MRVEPSSVAEVSAILRSASESGETVTPTGGPPEDIGGEGIVLSTRRLAGLSIYEPADLTVTAGAGTTLSALDDAVGQHRQWVPVDSPLAPFRSLGALVATGDGGPLWAGYGGPRDHVLGVTMVTGDGRVLGLGGRVMKNVAGFDLVRLVVGSRGALGVVVSACIRVFPRPEVDRALVLEGDLADLCVAARAVATAPVMPASAVLAGLPGGPPKLVVRLHGHEPEVDSDHSALAARLEGPIEVLEGEAAESLFASVRDGCAEDALVMRLTALPAHLALLLSSGEDGPYVADIMSGRVRLAPSDPSGSTVRLLIERARELGGSAQLLRGGGDFAALFEESGPAVDLADRLRATFDPAGTMSPACAR